MNVNGTLNLRGARDNGINRVVVASSSTVYGKPRYLLYDEEHPTTLVPLGVFAFSAHIFDALARVMPSEHGEYELTDAINRLFDESDEVEQIHLDGWLTNVTLALTFGVLPAYCLEQNVAYVLDTSPRQLVTLDSFPANALTQVVALLLHASGDHLVVTLVWIVPFDYFLERRRPWQDYVGFVVVAGFLTTTLVSVLFVILGGVSPGLGDRREWRRLRVGGT